MALTAQEEALVRQLLDEQAAILSLAGSEATILSKLGATKVTLSDLTAVSTVADADLLLMRQGTTDKSLSASILAAYANASVPDASTTVKGKVELATDAEAQSGTDAMRAVTPDNLGATVLGMGQTLQNLTASRALNTNYTNTTGRTIFINVTANTIAGSGTGNVVGIQIAGGEQYIGNGSDGAGAGWLLASFAPVQPNEVYRANCNNATLGQWLELR